MGPEEPKLQTNSIPPENAGPTLVTPAEGAVLSVQESAVATWIHRITLVVYVMVCIEIGLFLAVVPWHRVWTENSIVIAYPALRAFLSQNFVRGMVTGIGLMDVWLGISEAVHYRENKNPAPEKS